MASECCHLVGNFFSDTGFSIPGCIVSVNNTINTEFTDNSCGTMSEGPRIGTLNISGYADTNIYTGCPARAGVQILWMRKYLCEEDTTLFIYLGPGRSFMQDPASSYVSLGEESSSKTVTVSASSQSGPSTLFSINEQTEGLGMSYSKGPISFSTSSESGCTMGNMGVGTGSYYLQTFNIELVPGSIPIASYTFAYNA
jgi:hypothetical protein